MRDPSISRGEVKAFLDGLRANQDRPQRGYNSFVPLEPMNQLQVDLADMKAFGGKPYPCWWPSTRSPRKWPRSR